MSIRFLGNLTIYKQTIFRFLSIRSSSRSFYSAPPLLDSEFKNQFELPDTKPLLSQFNLNGLDSTSNQNIIKGLSSTKFVVGSYTLTGPILLANNAIFLWDVPQFGVGSKELEIKDTLIQSKEIEYCLDTESVFYGWTTRMMKIFEFIDPTPEIIIIGTGVASFKLPLFLKEYLYSIGCTVDVMTTKNATSTYNILLKENRRVAAAILPSIPTSSRSGKMLIELQESPGRPE